jgi:hypothetical protein
MSYWFFNYRCVVCQKIARRAAGEEVLFGDRRDLKSHPVRIIERDDDGPICEPHLCSADRTIPYDMSEAEVDAIADEICDERARGPS